MLAIAIKLVQTAEQDWLGHFGGSFAGGSGMGETAKVLEPCAPGATWLAGKRFEAGASSSEIARWIGKIEKSKQ